MESTLQYTSVSHADSMMDMINKMRRSSDFCDVTVVVGNFRIMAHRIILSASAPFFYELFKPCQLPSSIPEFHLDDVDETAALKIIEFCYTSALSLDEDTVWPLMVAATKLDFSEITALCCDFLTSSLDLSTCISIHLLAHKHSIPKLLANTKQFISENVEQLCEHHSLRCLASDGIIELITSLRDLLCSDSELLLLAKPWLEHNTEHRKQVSLKLSQEIPTFSKKLQEYLAHRIPSSDQEKIPAVENGIIRAHQTSVDSQFLGVDHQDPSDPNGVPLHICVSCGDEFDSQSQLMAHQKVCDESAHQKLCPEPAHQKECDDSADQKMSEESSQSAATNKLTPSFMSEKDGFDAEQALQRDDGENGFDPKPISSKPERLPFWPVLKEDPGFKGKNSHKISRSRERKMKSHNQSKSFTSDIEQCRGGDDRVVSNLARNQNNTDITSNQLGTGKLVECPNEIQLWSNVLSPAEEFSSEDNQSSSSDELVHELSGSPMSPRQSSFLNDTNNNDIRDLSAVFNDDSTGDEIDVVNDAMEDRPIIRRVMSDEGPKCGPTPVQFPVPFASITSLANKILNDRNQNGRSLLGNLKCQICDQHFNERKHLAKHWKYIHGMEHENGSQQSSKKPAAEGGTFLENEAVDTRQHGSNKKMNDEVSNGQESGGFHNVCKPECHFVNGGVKESIEELNPDVMKQLLRQYNYYNEFTKWCFEQGTVFCQVCMMYHAKGSMCPKSGLEQKTDQVISTCNDQGFELKPAKCNDQNESENDKCNSKEGSGEEDGPLDMSQSSQKYTAACKGAKFSVNHSSTNTPFVPLSQDLSQYYNNYAHIMAAAAAGNIQDRGHYGLLYPDAHSQPRTLDFPSESMYPPYFSYPTASPYPLNLASDNPRESSRHPQSTAHNNSTANHSPPSKRKVSSKQGFPCTVCSRVFSYQAALFTHMRTHSPSARLYQCTLCHQNFARAPDLKVHVCPNGIEKPYTCSSCGQTFAKNIHLKRHLATHSGLKPYPCWVCGKRFSRSDHLKRHTQSIHAGTRPHGCQVCGKEFVRKYELNKHMMSHTVEQLRLTGEQPSSTPGALDFGQSMDTISSSQLSQHSSPTNSSMS
ncbi:unnamed protein product [Lymnaea stagnalis]|uniref:Uncharacterized protein n=1 Tax=Lymnaea stagnalis TaxID=6523 RepID=A0AAV2HHM1_LYMST